MQIVSEPFDDAHGGRETPLGLPASISVALFDLDGVLTSTAVLHQKAWKQAFDHFLRKRHGDKFVPFSERDYLQYVDGRPRRDGVRTFLRSRQFEVADDVVEEIGTDKNELVLASLKRGEVESYPGSVRYLTALRETGVRVGVVTSSENGRAVLDAANLSRFVQERIDGTDIGRLKLRGKPAPDSFLACAQAFGVDPPTPPCSRTRCPGSRPAEQAGSGTWLGSTGSAEASTRRQCGKLGPTSL